VRGFDPPRYLKPGRRRVEADNIVCCAMAWSRGPMNPFAAIGQCHDSEFRREAIVSGLVAHGVEPCSACPARRSMACSTRSSRRSEGDRRTARAGLGYYAYGYARSTGRPGVFSVVPGPGVLNAGAALLTAFGSTSRCLCLTGQVPTQFLRQGPRPSARDAGPACDAAKPREMGPTASNIRTPHRRWSAGRSGNACRDAA